MYHFPKTYLRQASAAVGDWIIYYEPRRENYSLAGHSGRQCYFATARVTHINEDPLHKDHYYAFVDNYLEFDTLVPFKVGINYFESGLKKEDGSTNKGNFGRAVRVIKDEEYDAIITAGLSKVEKEFEQEKEVAEQEIAFEVNRHCVRQIVERPFREAAFSRLVKEEYGLTCSMTGLSIKNSIGIGEVEAAHIKPVQFKGPDSVRNGIALCRTFHWMFDRGLISVEDTGEIIITEKMIPERVIQLINSDGKIRKPSNPIYSPHKQFLKFHRENIFNSA